MFPHKESALGVSSLTLKLYIGKQPAGFRCITVLNNLVALPQLAA